MGYLADVVANTPILATWGNTVRSQSVMPFASAAERASQWTSPPEGAVCYLRDSDQVHVYANGAWVCITPVSATINTAENRISATYGDFPLGAGPSVTLYTGTKALVIVGAHIDNGGLTDTVYASYAVSGATTVTANDATALGCQGSAVIVGASFVSYKTGLTAGVNTFTMKYRARSNMINAQYRSITVVGIP